MIRLVAGGVLGWLCVACVLGGAAACSDSEGPNRGGAESGAGGEGANGGSSGSSGSSSSRAGSPAYGGEGSSGGNSGEGGRAPSPSSEGGAGGFDGVAGEPAVAVAGAGGEGPCVPDAPELPRGVPALIAAPEGTTLVRHLHAVGTQNYRCTQNPGDVPTFSWVLVAPVADLLSSCGVKVGSHFAVPGTAPPVPSWRYEADGSSVNGIRVEGSPVEGAIPELLLEQVAHGGDGVFSSVSFVQRLKTVGGLAPAADTCDAEHLELVQEIGYAAEYYFYVGGD
ncbi:MAG: DUF3455 domain-containing protein [Myxococcales bacterium]|nr:MAG: DUF3455 domain-containing protein [Myxococcales bacterium]